MNTLESSTRMRYWREAVQTSTKSLPAVWLAGIFILSLIGFILVASELGAIFIFVLALVFGHPFAKAVATNLGQNQRQGADATVANAPPAATGSEAKPGDPDIERLIQSLDSVEKRLIQLEDIVTDREFSWQRRLNEASKAVSGAGAPRVADEN